MKPYKRDTFENYFINTSRGQYESGKPTVDFEYDLLTYKYKRRTYHAFYKVLYNEDRDVIQIYMKETSDKTGWRANFDFASKYYDAFQYEGKDIQLHTATGWGQMYNSIKWNIRNQVHGLMLAHRGVEVEIIGWSLGSALAQLCAQDLFFNYHIQSHLFTFGSVKPWYGRNKDMREYLNKCCKECYNFGDINDIVTYLPPFIGYFKMRKVTVKQERFGLFKLFKPIKYHTQYWKPELYKDIE